MRRPIAAVLSAAFLLVALRLALDPLAAWAVNRVVAEVAGHRGSVRDVSVALLRGAYRIEGLELAKIDGGTEHPLLRVERLDLSIQWRALFRGSLVGEVSIRGASYNVVAAPPNDPETIDQAGVQVSWADRLDDLFPIRINRFELRDGELRYLDPHREPQVELTIDRIEAVGRNWGNVRDRDRRRFASLTVKARAFGSGQLELGLAADPLAPRPDLEIDLVSRDNALEVLNPFLSAYGEFDVATGTMDLYAEFDARDGRFDGYLKPLLRGLEVVDEDDESFARDTWEGFVGALAEILENQPEDQQGSKIPVSGVLEAPRVGVLQAVATIFSNAFLEALPRRLEAPR